MAEKENKPIRYSFSRLETYEQCPFKYLLKYVRKLYAGGPAIALEFGTAIHKTEEDIANMIKDGKPIDYITLKNNLIGVMYDLKYRFPKDFSERDKSGRTYDEKMYGYLNSGIYRLENYMRSHPELELVGAEVKIDGFNWHGHDFTGSIDRLLRDKNTGYYLVQDVKTYNQPKDDDFLAHPHQLAIYSLAVAQLMNTDPNKIKVSYDLPCCDIFQEAGTDENWIQVAEDELDKIFEEIKEEIYKPKPGPLCHWCEYCPTNPNQTEKGKNLCPYHSWWTKEKHSFKTGAKWKGMEEHDKVLQEYLDNQYLDSIING